MPLGDPSNVNSPQCRNRYGVPTYAGFRIYCEIVHRRGHFYNVTIESRAFANAFLLGVIMWVVIFVILFIFILVAKSMENRPKKTNRRQGVSNNHASSMFKPVLIEVRQANGDIRLDVNWPATFLVIEQATHARDYEFARLWLQKFSYTTVDKDVTQETRDQFKRLMTAFAKEDPLYQKLKAAIVPKVSANPGMLQTALYPQLPGYNQEQIRYALYFAHELGDVRRVKKGRTYQLFGPTQYVVMEQSQSGGITIEKAKNPLRERIAALHREATAHKGSDWNASIAALQEAAHLMRNSDYYEIDRMLRLPKFLEQAGRFNEAMKELDLLLSEVKQAAKNATKHSSSSLPSSTKCTTHDYYSQVYDVMSLVCKRKKLKDKEKEFRSLSEKHKLIVDELRKVLELEREAEKQAYHEKRAQILHQREARQDPTEQ